MHWRVASQMTLHWQAGTYYRKQRLDELALDITAGAAVRQLQDFCGVVPRNHDQVAVDGNLSKLQRAAAVCYLGSKSVIKRGMFQQLTSLLSLQLIQQAEVLLWLLGQLLDSTPHSR